MIEGRTHCSRTGPSLSLSIYTYIYTYMHACIHTYILHTYIGIGPLVELVKEPDRNSAWVQARAYGFFRRFRGLGLRDLRFTGVESFWTVFSVCVDLSAKSPAPPQAQTIKPQIQMCGVQVRRSLGPNSKPLPGPCRTCRFSVHHYDFQASP